MMRVGFGKATLWGSFPAEKRLADAVDARAMVVADGGFTAAFIGTDLSILWPSTCQRLRERIAAEMKIPVEHIGLFTTQNHCVPGGGDDKLYDFPALEAALLRAVRLAQSRLAAVEMAQVSVHPNPPLNLCRRAHLPELGAFTFWYGYKPLSPGRTDFSHLLKLALSGLGAGDAQQVRNCQLSGDPATDYKVPDGPVRVAEPFLAEPPADDAVQGLFFRTLDGRPVGSVVRFSTHPATTNRLGCDYHSSDYPGYVCRRVQEVFGGETMFLTGPCGDSCGPVGRKSLEMGEQFGSAIADQALAGLKGATWLAPDGEGAATAEVELRIRADYPTSRAAAQQRVTELEARIKQLAQSGAPLAQIKRLADEWEFMGYVAQGFFHNWIGLDCDHLAGGAVRHPMFLLRMGDAMIVGLGGEPFGRFSTRLREETLGEKLIVAEQGNGYLGYLPTAAEYPLGSYEVNASLFAPESEEVLIGAARSAILRLAGRG